MQHGRIVEEFQLSAERLIERFREIGLPVLHEVPFVRGNDDPASCLVRLACDRGVLIGGPGVGIDDHHHNVGRIDCAPRQQNTDGFNGATARYPPGSADARRVDDAEAALVPGQHGIHSVACGSGHLADDHPLLSEQAVHEGRLPRVRSADNSHSRLVGFPAIEPPAGRACLQMRGISFGAGRPEMRLWQESEHLIQQIAHARRVLGRDLHHVIEPELVEIHDAPGPLVVDLVDGQDRRHVGRAHRLRNVPVAGDEPFPPIDDEYQQVRRGNRPVAARQDKLVQRILAGAKHPAGIDQLETHALPLRGLGQHVAGGAGNRRHNRTAAVADAVEQRRLPHVGAADQHYGRQGHNGSVDSVSLTLYSSYSFLLKVGTQMIKVDIVNEVSKVADITKVKAEVAVDAVFDAMRLSMQRGDRIELRGFGVFQVKPRKRGIGRNPRTGKEVRIPPGRTIRFKPGKDLQNIG